MSVITTDRQSKTFSTNFVSETAKFFLPPRFVLAESLQIKTNKQISLEVDKQHGKKSYLIGLKINKKPPSWGREGFTRLLKYNSIYDH